MLVSATSTPSGLDAPNASKVSKPDQINSINDLILHKAETIPNTPLIAYPASDHGSSDLADYTAKELDAFVDEAAKEYTRLGLLPKVSIHVFPYKNILKTPPLGAPQHPE